jgi:hypothetical protein
MAVTTLYPRYFQKSKAFLYPLLGIKKGSYYCPKQTYMAWENRYNSVDAKLVCLYEKGKAYKYFKNTPTYQNRLLHELIDLGPTLVACVYDFSTDEQDGLYFLNGNYSKLSLDVARSIQLYFGNLSQEWAYMETFLFPDKYLKLYSELLFDKNEAEDGLEVLKSVGELCSKPDIMKETLLMKVEETIYSSQTI